MTLPASGSISLSQVASELSLSTTGINLNNSSVRSLAGKASGAVSLSDLRGKSATPTIHMTAGTGGTHKGYLNTLGTTYGSVDNTSVLGQTVIGLDWAPPTTGPSAFAVYLSGLQAQNAFAWVNILGTTLNTSSLSTVASGNSYYVQANDGYGPRTMYVWFIGFTITSGTVYTVTFG